MSQALSDDELRVLMRGLSVAAGVPLSAERIEVVLRTYRTLLQNAADLMDVPLPLKREPATGFVAPRGAP